jgi:hyperosmotically inducible protein
MFRHFMAAFLVILVGSVPAARAQGPIERVGQALDNAGRNIRRGVENAVARGQISAAEQELIERVLFRIRWDKQLSGSVLQLEVPAYGAVILRGSVASKEIKARAVDLVQNTIGVTSVVDELAVLKDAKVIQARPAEVVPGQVVEAPAVLVPAETRVIIPPSRTVVVPPGTEVVVPKGTTVIEKR